MTAGEDSPGGLEGVECGLTKEECAKSEQESTCHNCDTSPHCQLQVNLLQSDSRIIWKNKGIRLPRIGFFFPNKNHERIIKTVGYWC